MDQVRSRLFPYLKRMPLPLLLILMMMMLMTTVQIQAYAQAFATESADDFAYDDIRAHAYIHVHDYIDIS